MRPLPLEQVADFERRLERCWWTNRSWSKRRDALMLGAMLLGLRSIEARKIRLRDLSGSDGVLFVRTAKGGPGRTVPVGDSWLSAVRTVRQRGFPRKQKGREDLAFVTHSGDYVSYEQLRRRCREWTRAVFGESFTLHCLRHTAALRMYRATADVLAVQRFLGHASLRWTATYLAMAEPAMRAGLPDFVQSDRRHALLRLYRGDVEDFNHGRTA